VLRNTSLNGIINFDSKADFTTAVANVDVTVADLDGDGKPDLASGVSAANNVSLFRNTSSGIGNINFAAKVELPGFAGGGTTGAIAIHDIDGDGKPDIAFTNQTLNLLSIYRNTSVPGSLSFDTRIDMSGGSASRSIKMSDIDGDGKPDIVLATDIQTFQVYLNQSTPGSISLAPKVSFVAGSGSSALSIGDIDGDGKPDVAVTNETSNSLSVLRNQSTPGSISFASKVDYALDNAPRGVTFGDIDGDGKIDVSVTCYNSSILSIFRNTSTAGSLALTKINFSTDANPRGIVFGDLNGDGKPDLAVANNGANTISIFQQDCLSPDVPTLNASSTNNCGSQNTTLSIASGNLNNASNWQWYSGSCGGTSAGSGSSITVSPTVTTTYYVRGEGGCVSPGQCASITITVSTPTTLYRDADGDGFGDPSITTQGCPTGGYVTDNTDCNDNDANVHTAITYYRDFDNDGFGDLHNSTSICSSTPPPGYVTNSLDCDDTRALYEDLDGDGFGSTVKVPCGVSNNTDCDDDDDVVHPVTWYRDNDVDGFGNPFITAQSCLPLPGYVLNNADCNDADAFVHPGAAEICDGKDNDCNGIIDDGVKTTYYRDADGDGFGNPFVTTQSCTAPSGYVSNNTDCDDSHATVYPGAPEFCDGLDNNCNGVVDEGVKQTFYRDADGDGYGNAAVTTQSCAPPTGYVNNSLDCNDADGSVHPGAVEVCDGKDNDCNGLIDDGVKTTFYLDFDGDGYGDYEMTIQACSMPAGYVTDHSDCNDNDASVHTPVTYYRDSDGDGFGNVNNTTSVCSSTPPTGYVVNADDCDDTKVLYADNDGDGYGAGSPVVCGVPNNSDCNDADKTAHTAITYYKDNDGDGFGDIDNTTTVCSSTPPTGYVANADDCDDATVLYADNDGDGYGAGSAVACGVADNSDCNDDDARVHTAITYYKDSDGDGFGDFNNTTSACSSNAPAGYTANGGDCDDRNANVHPGAQEVCNGIDDDCDGLIDDADPSTDPSTKTAYYRDADGDGYGNPSIPILLCAPGAGWVMDNTDCNDADASVHPGATEIADNNIDEDCDGSDLKTWYRDSDGDGYGNYAVSTTSNTKPNGYVSNNFDCNDSNAQVHPGAQEVCNGIDDDCDGLIDDADPSTDPSTKTTYYRDADGDGYGDPSIPILLCAPGPGWVMDNRDCNDADASIHAGVTYYKDNDGDGFGNLNNTTIVCSSVAPSGYVTNSSDCDDTKLLYKDADGDGYGAGSPVACGVANNTDCNDNDASMHSPVQYYVDADHDGYGSSTTAMLCSSTAPFGYSTISGDCSDNSSSVHPGAVEICGNGIDDNCNGSIDENCNVCANATALTTTSVTSTSATLNWVASVNPVQWNLQYKTTAPGAKWTDMLLAGSARSVTLSGLKSQQSYSWHIRAKCGTKWTSYSISASFKTTSALSVVAQSLNVDRPDLKLYPNPSSGQFIVELRGLGKINSKVEIQLMDINGKTVQKENAELSNGSLQKIIRIAPALSQGMYMVRIVINDKIYDARLIYSK
ncbi:MAG TPA: MopE-related protein, partial [Parafilimonas sp.]|nr:MopE-related protein [Parafilimonas sp.]